MLRHMADETAGLLDVVTGCHKLLSPLDAPTRSKAIRMLLLAFDEENETSSSSRPPQVPQSSAIEFEPASTGNHVNRRAQYWLKKYELREEELERVLDLDNDYALIAHLPGDSKREQAISCYLLTGIQAMLRTGEPKFSDEEAVGLCKREGCYDRANHSMTRTQLGKRVTGDKESAFTLTTLGLEQAARLIQEMARASK